MAPPTLAPTSSSTRRIQRSRDRSGALDARYDDAGNLTRLQVTRHGPCTGSSCNQLFAYDWDEVGRLVTARRWDGTTGSIDDALPTGAAAAHLEYTYDAGDDPVFFHGSPKPDAKPGQPHFSEVPHPRSEVKRLLDGRLAKSNGRVTLALGILGPHYSTLDVSQHDFRLAREFGLVASMHQGGGEPKTPGGWDQLEQDGLVGEGVNIVHGHGLSDDQIKRFCDAGVSFSTTPENEMTQGHGFPVTGKVRAAGGLLSLGVDLESVLSGDMFTVGRMALGMQRALDNDASRRETGSIPDTTTIPVREALAWITIDGARAIGLGDEVGSLTPGKQADLVVLRRGDLNMGPLHDPISTVVMQAGPRNIDSVMIAGEFQKKDGQLLLGDLEPAKQALAESGHRIAAELRRRKEGEN